LRRFNESDSIRLCFNSDQLYEKEDWKNEAKKVIEIAMWANEPVAFDPMEKACIVV
jgi:hypothetical protein